MTRRAVFYIVFPDGVDLPGLALADRYVPLDPELAGRLEGYGMPAGPDTVAVKAAGDMLALPDDVTIDYAVIDVRRWRIEVGLTGPGLPAAAEHLPGHDRWTVPDWDRLIRFREQPRP